MARRLRDRHRFLFVCLDELGTLGEELRGEGFDVRVLGRRPGVDWRCAGRLAALLRRERVDLIHAHQYTPFFYGMAARLLYRRPPLLFTEHGRWFPDYPRRKRMLVNRLLLRRRDRAVGVGESVRRALIDNEGLPSDRVDVIYNGIDLGAFSARPAERGAVRREIGLGADDFVILQVARLDPLKDHATAVRMMGHVARRLPGARLVLVGEGPEEGKIRRMVRERSLDAHVLLLGLRTDVPRLLSAADVVLLTSVSEGIPLTLIEGMAAALPAVSTNVGGVREVVEDRETGLLAPSGDDAALAAAIVSLAEHPEFRARMGRRGRERAGALFSDRQMHAAYRRLYEEMLRV
jgi:glycosyltransferase involved in cell wall biosynthesis